MQLPTIEIDLWELADGEKLNRENPKTFWIPSRHERENLAIGDATKLVFQVGVEKPDGSLEIEGERMWVIVTGRLGEDFLGVLDNDPVMFAVGPDIYLGPGAEIPFRAEHVIAIQKSVVPPERVPPALRRWSPRTA